MTDPRTAFAVFTEIGIIHQLAARTFERALPAGLALSQFAVLDHLLRLNGDWSPARLARAFQVTRSTMTNTLQRLAAAGFVTIAPDRADGRAKLVHPTPAGKSVRDAAVAALAPELAQVTAHIPPGLLTALHPGLMQLRAALDAARD